MDLWLAEGTRQSITKILVLIFYKKYNCVMDSHVKDMGGKMFYCNILGTRVATLPYTLEPNHT